MGFNTEITDNFLLCNIGQTEYDCGFAIELESDLEVYKIKISDKTQTELFLNVDYTLSDVGFDLVTPITTTVKVTLLVALSDEYKLYVKSIKSYKIAIDLPANVAQAMAKIAKYNLQLDRQIQQLKTELNYCLKFEV